MLKKGDIILVVLIIAVVVIGYLGLNIYNNTQNDRSNRIAVIKKDNSVIKEIDLDRVEEAARINIEGDYHNVILVETGRIRYEKADCPDQVCVNTGWLTQVGDVAVCMPNRTIIKIEGQKPDVDGVTY